MGLLDDTITPAEAQKTKQSVTQATVEDILRNIAERVALDGTRDLGLLELLNAISCNTNRIGLTPRNVASAQGAAIITNEPLIANPSATEQIVIWDLFLSLNGVANASFNDLNGTRLLATMYAPNAGQGFTMSSFGGLFLPIGKSLCYSISAAVSYSLHVSYSLINTL